MKLSKAAVRLLSSILLLSSSYSVETENDRGGVDHSNIVLTEGQERFARIIGGEDANPGDYPWYTFVQTPSSTPGYVNNCGGQLISPTVVLTAAHCVKFDNGDTKPANKSRVWVGAYEENNRSSFDVPQFGLTAILPHPDYNPNTLEFDFALLFLDGEVTTTEPVLLDLDGISETFQGVEDILAIGFGDTDAVPGEDNVNIPTTLQEVTMKHITNDNCIIFGTLITNAMLCAGDGRFHIDGGKGTCQGDSGGPFFITRNDKSIVVGVVSFGPSLCGDYNSVSARVSAVAGWIRENVDELPTGRNCSSDGISPSEYILPAKFGKTNYCYRIQVEDGGKLSVDTKDTGCANFNAGNAYNGAPISTYQRTDPGGMAIYKGSWSGSITLLQDLSLSDSKFELSGNGKTKIFVGTLTVPACNSICESIEPSEYILPAKFGTTNHCYRLQVEDGGKLSVDTKDTGCANFNAGNAYNGAPISTYQRTDPGGEAIYGGAWSGSILLALDPSLSEAKLEMSGNTGTKTFAGTLTVPACTSPVCDVKHPSFLNDGFCDGGEYNTPQCNYDEGDCDEFNRLYPNCIAEIPWFLGNGHCEGGDYNTIECGYDGGDCVAP